MKRHLIFLLFALAIVFVANAQSSLIAVLSHNGEIQTFTGNKALILAYNAAQSGDIITLSPGQFDAVNINKPLTIRGAGMYRDNATIINGYMDLSPWNSNDELLLEGLAFTSVQNIHQDVKNLSMMKCYIHSISTYSSNKERNIRLSHCDIGSTNISSLHNMVLISSRIARLYNIHDCILMNCILENNIDKRSIGGSNNQYLNCIFDCTTATVSSEYSNNIFRGCVYIGEVSSPFASNVPSGVVDCKVFPSGTQYLKEGTTTFELLDELQTTWLGTDGTQVGMHGGSFPFDPTTTNPQIKRFDVSSKTSADGKLSVDIEVDIK